MTRTVILLIVILAIETDARQFFRVVVVNAT